MRELLESIRRKVESQAPHLLPVFDTLASEAKFARGWLDRDLQRIGKGARILEVGAGAFVLTATLAREGYDVTAVEPIGSGFGALEELGAVVLDFAAREAAQPTVIRCKAEELQSDGHFDFAFSINVMEHVDAPDAAVMRISAALGPGGSYRFLCPNYIFPYEPHFNIPTFGSKRLTEKLMRSRIVGNKRASDPAGLWNSLNWITVPMVRRIAAGNPSLALAFDRSSLATIIERAVDDEEFAKRRSPWVVHMIKGFKGARLLRLLAWIPLVLHPLMDVRITRTH